MTDRVIDIVSMFKFETLLKSRVLPVGEDDRCICTCTAADNRLERCAAVDSSVDAFVCCVNVVLKYVSASSACTQLD